MAVILWVCGFLLASTVLRLSQENSISFLLFPFWPTFFSLERSYVRISAMESVVSDANRYAFTFAFSHQITCGHDGAWSQVEQPPVSIRQRTFWQSCIYDWWTEFLRFMYKLMVHKNQFPPNRNTSWCGLTIKNNIHFCYLLSGRFACEWADCQNGHSLGVDVFFFFHFDNQIT